MKNDISVNRIEYTIWPAMYKNVRATGENRFTRIFIYSTCIFALLPKPIPSRD